MDLARLHRRRSARAVFRTGTALAVLLVTACLLVVPPSFSAAANNKGTTFEDRAEAERISRSRYRDLEVASLIIIVVAGAGAILWAVRRRKP
jgi:protein-S-isoprenylcysteine O-methyltransferase Ste14